MAYDVIFPGDAKKGLYRPDYGDGYRQPTESTLACLKKGISAILKVICMYKTRRASCPGTGFSATGQAMCRNQRGLRCLISGLQGGGGKHRFAQQMKKGELIHV